MNTTTAIRIAGVAVVTFVFWHFWQLWGFVLGCGIAMLFLP